MMDIETMKATFPTQEYLYFPVSKEEKELVMVDHWYSEIGSTGEFGLASEEPIEQLHGKRIQ